MSAITSSSFEIRKSKRNCVSFDGTDDYIDCGNNHALQIYTVAVKFRTSATLGSRGYLVNKGGEGSDTAGQNDTYSISMNTDGTIRGGFEEGSGADHYLTSAGAYNNGKIHQAVLMYDQTNLKLYVDAVEVGTQSQSTLPETNAIILAIGRNARSSANFFNGIIFDVRIWNVGLSPTQITSLYNNDEDNVPLPVYWLAMDEGTGNPRDSIGDTLTGTLTGGAAWTSISGIGGEMDISASGLINLNEENNYWRAATGSEAINGSNLYRIFYIKFLGPGEVKQTSLALNQKPKSGYENFQWTFDPNARKHPYRYRPFKTFNGTSDFVQVPHAAALSLLQHSIAMWFRTTASGSVDYLIVKGNFGSEVAGNNFNYSMLMTASNLLQYFWETSAGVDKFVNSPTVVNDGLWHLAVATYDQINLRLYLDGTQIGVLAETGTPDTNTMDVFIGAHGTGGASNFWSGDIDEVRIWNNDLTAQEIKDMYQKGIVPQVANMVYENTFGIDNGHLDKIAQIMPSETDAPVGSVDWQSESITIPTPANVGDLETNQYYPVIGWWSNIAGTPDIENSLAQLNQYYALPSGAIGSGPGSSIYHYESFGIFNTVTDVVTENDSAALDLTRFTVASWFRTNFDYTDGEGTLIRKGFGFYQTSADVKNYFIKINNTPFQNEIEAGFEELDGTGHFVFTDGKTWNDGQWHFAIVTYDGVTVVLYIDGIIQHTHSTSATPGTNARKLYIGADPDEPTSSSKRVFHGNLDEVRVWNVAITATEASDLYQSGIVPKQSNIVYENLFGGSSGTGGSSGDPQTPPTNVAVTFVENADWGEESMTETIVSQAVSFNPNFVLDAGDKAYESNPDSFLSIIAPLKSIWIDSYGNHDSSSDFLNEFPTSKIFYQNIAKTYYYKIIQNIAIIVMDTNISFSSGSAQYIAVNQFFADIKNNPNVDWTFVTFHHPTFGATSTHPYNEGNFVQTWMPIFDTNLVDIVFMGHNHNYERTYPLKYNSASPTNPTVTNNSAGPYTANVGTIYLRNGTGGHDEGSSLYSLGTQKPFTIFQNAEENGNVKGVFSNNNKTLTVAWITVDGQTRDSFVINK